MLGKDMGNVVAGFLELMAALVNVYNGLPPSHLPEQTESKPYSSAPQAAAKQETYRWSNVTSVPEGTRIKVCDVVSEINEKNGVYFVDFGGSYPNNVAFIRSRDGSKVPKPGQKSCHVGSLERSSGGKYYTLQD